jgi:hypothetical protein
VTTKGYVSYRYCSKLCHDFLGSFVSNLLFIYLFQYIILDDIMDLMGSDAMTSEDDMERMWGDGVKTLKGQHARITYDDFLLLMKGQTMESHSEIEGGVGLEAKGTAVNGNVPASSLEASLNHQESGVNGEVNASVQSAPVEESVGTVEIVNVTDHTSSGTFPSSQPSPVSPPHHKDFLPHNIEYFDSPVSMDDDGDDDDDHVIACGPGVPGSAASLTPPASPLRGTDIYATPGAQRRAFCELKDFRDGLDIPSLPKTDSNSPLGLSRPPMYTRRRSRSLDEQETVSMEKPAAAVKEDDSKRLSAVAEVVLEMILPETDHSLSVMHNEITESIHDESKTALVVNRKLYRAHRQMRLAVLEASKRFEEQQAEHAKEVILAEREESEKHRLVQAGLVMRHGHKKQVSSKSIRSLLERNREQQTALVEKANRSSGRGRRSRKKTVSDMSSMLTSLGPDDLKQGLAKNQSSAIRESSIPEDTSVLMETTTNTDSLLTTQQQTCPTTTATTGTIPDVSSDDEILMADLEQEGHVREATVPGDFRTTTDPFGTAGRYYDLTQSAPVDATIWKSS